MTPTTGPYVVGIDCGSQSAKVAIFDAAGRQVASGRQPLRPMYRPSNGVVLHPDDDLWDATAAACRAAMEAFAGDPSEIAGVGLCPIRCCKAYLRADGSLVEPVMSWMDDRAYSPYLPPVDDLAYATTASGYLTHRFTGRFADTAANSIDIQWPIDADTWVWSDDPAAYERHGVPRSLLFELVMPGDVLGPLTRAAAAATGLPEGIPVVATANDKGVEMLGAGVAEDDAVLVSLGTYICAMTTGHEHHCAPAAFWTNFACAPRRYLYESNGVRRGMWTLSWFLDLLGPELAAHCDALGVSREEYLEAEAVDVPAGSDGLMTILDWLAPGDAPFRKGSMLGFDARHTRAHIYRSIMEAIALTMHGHVTAMLAELGRPLRELVVSGGGSSSPLFMQIFADVFDLPARRATAGAALGAAICAAAATGLHADIPAAVAAMTVSGDSFVPSEDRHQVYAELEATHLSVREYTDPLYRLGTHDAR